MIKRKKGEIKMNKNGATAYPAGERAGKWTYRLVIFFLALSGFGQMPIYKRYYLADIPGMKWVGDFFITHYIHYLTVIFFLGLIAYRLADYLISTGRTQRITLSGYIRAAWITGIILTGACLVINNFTGTRFSAGFIIFLDLSHIGFVMLMFITAVYCKIAKKKWVAMRP